MLPISVDGDYPLPTALPGACRGAVEPVVGVADPLGATALPTTAVSKSISELSLSVASDAPLYAYGSLPLFGSAVLVAAGVLPGHLHLGSE